MQTSQVKPGLGAGGSMHRPACFTPFPRLQIPPPACEWCPAGCLTSLLSCLSAYLPPYPLPTLPARSGAVCCGRPSSRDVHPQQRGAQPQRILPVGAPLMCRPFSQLGCLLRASSPLFTNSPPPLINRRQPVANRGQSPFPSFLLSFLPAGWTRGPTWTPQISASSSSTACMPWLPPWPATSAR